ncbi:hypothetical protein M5K25_006631 [Dendrobium thyrsiflorum]|uniref:Uncharacterized protein n=1 Tax=Dendrobium thyrsiflorum TaxID=117978 RepID=A0ABD0VIW7_DENTH
MKPAPVHRLQAKQENWSSLLLDGIQKQREIHTHFSRVARRRSILAAGADQDRCRSGRACGRRANGLRWGALEVDRQVLCRIEWDRVPGLSMCIALHDSVSDNMMGLVRGNLDI